LYYDFEWDPKKERNNIRRRNLSFRRAATVFHDPNQLTLFVKLIAHLKNRKTPYNPMSCALGDTGLGNSKNVYRLGWSIVRIA
jgi:hypothetical protein